MKKKYFLLVLIGFIILSISLMFLIRAGPDKESILWSRTATTETWKNPDGTYTTTLYSGQLFRDDKSKIYANYVPFEDTINITEENGKIKIYDKVTDEIFYIELEYEKSNIFSDKKAEIIIEKNDGSWYFETDAKEEVNSMAYKIINDEKNKKNITFEYEKLKLGDLSIDFSQARIEQNITTTYNEKTNKLIFEVEDGKIGDLSKIDPTVTLQTADTDNLKDSFVYYDDVTSNFGEETYLHVAGYAPFNAKTYLSFNLTSISGDISQVNEANLSLECYSGDCDGNFSIFHVYNDWINGTGENILNETQITWNNQPCGVDFDNSTNCNLTSEDNVLVTSSSSNYWVNWSVKNMLSSEINSGDYNVSMVIVDVANGDGVSFNSKESGTSSTRPKLIITYTPYININSPTSSQTFTQDAPTTIFNITNNSAFDVCYAELDNSANFSLTYNSPYWNLTNTSMIDGTHNVSFWCNQSDDGTWRQSDSVSFDVDSVNITVCRDLTVSRTYYLRNNVSSSTSCFDSSTNNINFDGLGYTINGTGGNTGAGIFFRTNSTIANVTITNFNGAIRVQGNNITINNVNLNGYDDSFQSYGANGTISDSIVSPCTDISADGCIWYNNSISNFNFTNVTYGTGNETISVGSTLTRKWYVDIQVNDSDGYLSNAQVDIYDKDSNLEVSQLTNSTGQIPRQELIDYINNAGVITYNTPHTINVSKTNYYTNSTSYNLTSVNNVNHIVTLENTNAAPTSTLYSPTNNAWSDSLTNTMICNQSDSDGNLKNVTIYTWLGGSEETKNTKSVTGSTNSTEWTNLGFTSNGAYEWNCYVCDDEDECAWASNNRTLNIDTVYPLIDYGLNTENNATNFSRDWIYVNVSVTESHFKNITFNLFNSTFGEENSTTYTSEIYEINWTGLSDDVYYYNVTIYDNASNSNSTETRKITIDDTSPIVTIIYPIDSDSYSNGTDFQINYTVSDNLVGLNSCWYTNDSGINNYSLTCGNNITHTFTDDTYTYTIYANDTLNNLGSDTVTFTISSVAPSINKQYPTDTLWINSGTNVYFNYTATDSDGLDTCQLWGNWSSWHNNYTWSDGLISGTQNYTTVNLTDGIYKYNIWCNDSLGNSGFSPTNFTFQIDETFPQVTNQSFTPITVYNNLDVTIFGNATDTNLEDVWIQINHSGTYQNITITDKIGNQYNYTISNSLISNHENISWKWWANDSAGNENSSELQYFVVTNRNPYNLTISNPSNETYINTNYLIINFSATDDDSDTLNYSVYYSNDSITFELGNWTTGNYANLTGFNFTNNATNYFYVEVSDNYLTNSTENYTFYIDNVNPTAPTITLPEASPVYQCSMTNLLLNYSVSDDNLDYCIVNSTCGGSVSTYSTTIAGCVNTTFNVSYDDCVHQLNLFAYDKAGNSNLTTRLVYIDTNNAGCSTPETPVGGGISYAEEQEDLGFCGDGVCNDERGESFYNCPEDCSKLGDILNFKNFNLDKIFFNCVDRDKQTECFWTTNPAWFFIFISVAMVFLFSILFEFRGTGGMKKVVFTGFKKKRKRR